MAGDLTKHLRCQFANGWVIALKEALNFLLFGWGGGMLDTDHEIHSSGTPRATWVG